MCRVIQEIVELAGYTSRVGSMLNVFDQVGRGQYQKTTVAAKSLLMSPRLQYQNGQLLVKGSFLLHKYLDYGHSSLK